MYNYYSYNAQPLYFIPIYIRTITLAFSVLMPVDSFKISD
jgi:hypothetical protein